MSTAAEDELRQFLSSTFRHKCRRGRDPAVKMGDAPPPHNNASSLSTPTLYFGYGSNLWKHQMSVRCPTSEYKGIARLKGYKWIINDRGYANVVELSSSSSSSSSDSSETEMQQPGMVHVTKKKRKKHDYANEVWGLVYTLQPDDEDDLDRNEGVPVSYTKEFLDVDFWKASSAKHDDDGSAATIDVHLTKSEEKSMLVYINRNRTSPDRPKKEYIYRMNKGIEDAVKEGVPKEYVRDVLRKFIPESVDDEDAEKVARRQAIRFEDEL